MKQTVLLCDWCRHPRKFAVATLSLTNGRGTKGGQQLDLCGRHIKRLQKLFAPKKSKADVRTKRGHGVDAAEIEAAAMRVANKMPEFTARDVATEAGSHISTAARVVANLIKAHKIKAKGKNRARKLSKA